MSIPGRDSCTKGLDVLRGTLQRYTLWRLPKDRSAPLAWATGHGNFCLAVKVSVQIAVGKIGVEPVRCSRAKASVDSNGETSL